MPLLCAGACTRNTAMTLHTWHQAAADLAHVRFVPARHAAVCSAMPWTDLRGMIPLRGPSSSPSMVYVLPVPVCPYAMMAALYPCTASDRCSF
jgi:hypothetical protein